MATTFRISSKQPEQVRGFGKPSKDDKKHVATHLLAFKKNHCTDIVGGTQFPDVNIRPSHNGFVRTVIDAYNLHHNLVIRPDDVWIAIVVQFSLYVNDNAEEFRGKFVNFEGKKELEVSVNGRLFTAPYDVLVDLMTAEIHKNLIDDQIKNWILPDFSTTQKDDIVTCGVILMGAMKKYFEYKFCLRCGIPNVTLEGTMKDWETIRVRLNKLRSYNLDKWVDMLEPILTQFINAKLGKVDKEFWDRICHHTGGGSGPTYICGWITAFCVFDKEGKWHSEGGDREVGAENEVAPPAEPDQKWLQVDMDEITPGVVEVDVLIDDNGTKYKSVMFAGHMASQILEDGCTLQPKSGWVIAVKPDGATSDEGEPNFDEDDLNSSD